MDDEEGKLEEDVKITGIISIALDDHGHYGVSNCGREVPEPYYEKYGEKCLGYGYTFVTEKSKTMLYPFGGSDF